MLLEYKNFKAQLTYCGKTKCYHGEILGIDHCITFQATNRSQAILVMQTAVDQYLRYWQDLVVH